MLSSSSSIIAASLLLACSTPLTQAWVPSSPTFQQRSLTMPTTTTTTRLFSTIGKRDRNRKRRPSGEDEYDLDSARAALEDLMMQNSMMDGDDNLDMDNNNNNEDSFPSREASLQVLTSAGRHRRQLELDLLRQLHIYDSNMLDDDEMQNGETKAVDELMHLWMYEHDAESAMQLEAMQKSCSPGMVVEEEQLRVMRKRFPTWAEPRARLAILLFMKGISEEAYEMACEALELKPWHFEVYPILVMICLRWEDMGQALYWARRALPAYRPNSQGNLRRRSFWIEKALECAAEQWEQAEQEMYLQQHQHVPAANSTNGDSWQ